MISPALSVIIPTFRRPDGLALAMESIRNQRFDEDIVLELIICDNSPEGSAKPQVEAFAGHKSLKVIYLHEPNPGVANARNLAIGFVKAPLLAFLDDDEVAPEGWLSAMTATQRDLSADVVFGPVKARIKEEVRQYRAYFEAFFSRSGPQNTGRIEHYYGCGNSLIRMACLGDNKTPFNIARNDIGGEDDLLFYELISRGCVFAWDSQAFVYEDVPLSRSKLSYTLRRGFAYGQGPSQAAMSSNPSKPLICSLWMLQGLAQGLIFSGLGLCLWLMRHHKAAGLLDKAARGFGKTLWFPPFKQKFYGSSLLLTTSNTTAKSSPLPDKASLESAAL